MSSRSNPIAPSTPRDVGKTRVTASITASSATPAPRRVRGVLPSTALPDLSLRDDITRLTNELKTAKAAQTTAENALTALKSKATQLQAELEKANSDNIKLQDEASVDKKQIETYKTSFDQRNEEHKAQTEKLLTSAKAAAIALADAQSENVELKEGNVRLNENIRIKDERCMKLEKDLATSEGKVLRYLADCNSKDKASVDHIIATLHLRPFLSPNIKGFTGSSIDPLEMNLTPAGIAQVLCNKYAELEKLGKAKGDGCLVEWMNQWTYRIALDGSVTASNYIIGCCDHFVAKLTEGSFTVAAERIQAHGDYLLSYAATEAAYTCVEDRAHQGIVAILNRIKDKSVHWDINYKDFLEVFLIRVERRLEDLGLVNEIDTWLKQPLQMLGYEYEPESPLLEAKLLQDHGDSVKMVTL